MADRLCWQIMVFFLFLLFLSSCIIKVDTEKNSLVFVPRLQQQSQKLLSHSTASTTTVEVRQHSQPPPHRHQFLKLEKRNEMNEEKEAASSLDEASEVFRHKRFYPMHVNIGCVKGYKCCTDARCKPFCTLCYGYFNGTSNYTTTPKCQDQNENGICDDQEEDDYDESDEQKAEDDDYDESDEQKAEEEDYDESDEIKSDDDDYDESDEQMAERESKTNKTTTQAPHKNSYELTYHLYEEYLPPPTAPPPTPPIIVQTMPHISLNNYFSSHSGQKAPIYHPGQPAVAQDSYLAHHDLPRLYYEDLTRTNHYHGPKVPLTTHIVNDAFPSKIKYQPKYHYNHHPVSPIS